MMVKQPLLLSITKTLFESDTTSKQFCERIDFYRKYTSIYNTHTHTLWWRAVAGADVIIIIHHLRGWKEKKSERETVLRAWWPHFLALGNNEFPLRTLNINYTKFQC